MATPTLAFLAVLSVSAFALPLLFLTWVRNTERLEPEPWHAVLKSFAWGAVLSVIIAIIFSLILLTLFSESGPLYAILSQRFEHPETLFGVLIVAPFVEEAAKGVAVRPGRRFTDVRVDGLVYGAAAGFGFSATENLFYGLAFFGEVGASGSLLLVAFRSVSSSLLHASATGVTGYGVAKGWLTRNATAFLPFYMVAVIMHASFNALAGFGELFSQQYGEIGGLIGLAAAVGLAIGAMSVIRLKLATQPSPIRS